MKQYIGVDPSITCTAITAMSEDLSYIKSYIFTDIKKYSNIKYESFNFVVFPKVQRELNHIAFYNNLTDLIIDTFDSIQASMPTMGVNQCKIMIEGYSYGSKGMVFNIAEYVGILKYKLLCQKGRCFFSVAPTSVKKFIRKGSDGKYTLFNEFINNQVEVFPEQWKNEFKSIIKNDVFNYTEKTFSDSPIADIMDSIYITMYSMADPVEIKNKKKPVKKDSRKGRGIKNGCGVNGLGHTIQNNI